MGGAHPRSQSEGGSDTHHAQNERDGFREGLNPSSFVSDGFLALIVAGLLLLCSGLLAIAFS
jgi:hypothetical protein